METQNLLYSRSAEIPEGLYIQLMNTLKIDFETSKKQQKIKYVFVDHDIYATRYNYIMKILYLITFIFLQFSVLCFYHIFQIVF